jgi:predicted GNAT family N-acyltransferase
MQIRPYTIADREDCLRVFRSNVPHYFAPNEEADFDTFLLQPIGSYFVMLKDDQIIGCGGFEISADGTEAGLTWGMVTREAHGQGWGRLLLIYRISALWGRAPHALVIINTSQHTAPFFEKYGFIAIETHLDHFAPGLHEVIMILRPALPAS